jgi:hypothetical protein
MATVAAPSGNDIYLALLAGRAVTGLAKLASDPERWDEQIAKYLGDGLEYCKELNFASARVDAPVIPEFDSVLKRLTAQPVPLQLLVRPEEVSQVSSLLDVIISRTHRPTTEDLSLAIGFFVKASSGHSIQMQGEDTLF